MSDTDDIINTIIAEAGNKPQGMLAVANAINNRANKWGMDPGAVVRQKGQFAGYSDPGPGSVRTQQMPAVRQAAMDAWNRVSAGQAPDPTGGATDFRTTGSVPQQHLGAGINIDGNTFYPTQGTTLTSKPVPLAPLPPSGYASDTSPTTTNLATKLGGYAAKQGWSQPYMNANIPAAPAAPAAPTLGDKISEFAAAAKAAMPAQSAASSAPTPLIQPTMSNALLGVADKNKASNLFTSLLQPGFSISSNPYGTLGG